MLRKETSLHQAELLPLRTEKFASKLICSQMEEDKTTQVLHGSVCNDQTRESTPYQMLSTGYGSPISDGHARIATSLCTVYRGGRYSGTLVQPIDGSGKSESGRCAEKQVTEKCAQRVASRYGARRMRDKEPPDTVCARRTHKSRSGGNWISKKSVSIDEAHLSID